jgi:hypothetical protein
MKGGYKVASFEEIKMDKIGLPSLISYAYVESIQLAGNVGVMMPDLLMRRVMLNYEIESWLSPYIPDDSPYWDDAQEQKNYLTFEMARMPQAHTRFMRALACWNRLLMREEARNNLLLTKTMAARI